MAEILNNIKAVKIALSELHELKENKKKTDLILLEKLRTNFSSLIPILGLPLENFKDKKICDLFAKDEIKTNTFWRYFYRYERLNLKIKAINLLYLINKNNMTLFLLENGRWLIDGVPGSSGYYIECQTVNLLTLATNETVLLYFEIETIVNSLMQKISPEYILSIQKQITDIQQQIEKTNETLSILK